MLYKSEWYSQNEIFFRNLLFFLQLGSVSQYNLITEWVSSTQVRENGAVNSLKRCKTAKTGVLRRRFTSACNMTKIGGENDSSLLARKRLVKRASVLLRNTVKFKAVIRRFIVVSGRLRRCFWQSERLPWMSTSTHPDVIVSTYI
jgi:hypothetical protein